MAANLLQSRRKEREREIERDREGEREKAKSRTLVYFERTKRTLYTASSILTFSHAASDNLWPRQEMSYSNKKQCSFLRPRSIIMAGYS